MSSPSKSMYRIVRVNGKPMNTKNTFTSPSNNNSKVSNKNLKEKRKSTYENSKKEKSVSPVTQRPSPPRDYVRKSSTPPTPPRPSPPRQSPPKQNPPKQSPPKFLKRNSKGELEKTPPRPPPPVLYTSTLPPPVPKKMGGKTGRFSSKTLPAAVKRTAQVPKQKPLQKTQPLQVLILKSKIYIFDTNFKNKKKKN